MVEADLRHDAMGASDKKGRKLLIFYRAVRWRDFYKHNFFSAYLSIKLHISKRRKVLCKLGFLAVQGFFWAFL